MQQFVGQLLITTTGAGLHEITRDVVAWMEDRNVGDGLLTIFCRHTSASLLINENAAPAVRRDLQRYFARLAPESDAYEHDDEGPDDMPAHLRTALTQTSLSIPVIDGRPALGTWQGIYLFEHLARSHRRTLALHLIGKSG